MQPDNSRGATCWLVVNLDDLLSSSEPGPPVLRTDVEQMSLVKHLGSRLGTYGVGTSLVVRELSSCLAQGSRVQSQVGELDPMCCN